jgi:hypothetical protein
LRIIAIGATVNPTGSVVRLDGSPGSIGKSNQAMSMMQSNKRIVFGMDQEQRRKRGF